MAACVDAKPDLAYILGVHAAMPGICRERIAARVPFVLEKPGAAAVADLAAVRDEAEAEGLRRRLALVQRYGPLPGPIEESYADSTPDSIEKSTDRQDGVIEEVLASAQTWSNCRRRHRHSARISHDQHRPLA